MGCRLTRPPRLPVPPGCAHARIRRPQGAKFSQIIQMTDVFEGSIIRTVKRLEELLRQMCAAAKAIGNTELENKFAEGGSPSGFDAARG